MTDRMMRSRPSGQEAGRLGKQTERYGVSENTPDTDVSRAMQKHGVKGKKSIRWMPWRVEAMKDVVNCEKPWGVVNRL